MNVLKHMETLFLVAALAVVKVTAKRVAPATKFG